jgi:DnaJ family protein B protein 12
LTETNFAKIAKRCHPDKNQAPGSVEAFKVISKAYQILIDADKRRAFDVSGLDPDNRMAGQPSGPQFTANQFEAEISPEDLFEMFFGGMGGGFRATSFSSGPGFHFRVHQPNVRQRQPRQHSHEEVLHERRRQEHVRRRQETPTEEVSLRPLFTLLAILFLSLFSSLFSAWDPPVPRFALSRQHPYIQPLRTAARGVPYYVDPNNFPFLNQELDSADRRRLREVETQVEQSYLRTLQTQCQYEMQVKREKLQEARGFWGVDADALRKANDMKMEACDALRGWR